MSDMICIKIFENRMKAEVCKSYLEDQGVKVFLFSDDERYKKKIGNQRKNRTNQNK